MPDDALQALLDTSGTGNGIRIVRRSDNAVGLSSYYVMPQVGPGAGRAMWVQVEASADDATKANSIKAAVGAPVSAPPANEPPVFTVAPETASLPATGGTIQFTATDPDADTLTYTLPVTRTGITINDSSGVVTVTADAADTSGSITVRATDVPGLYVETTCAVTVNSAIVGTAVPSVYPLELIHPRAAGSTPGTGSDMPTNPTMPAGHRIFKAYPGIAYNIRAAVIGGSYPFTYALTNEPNGMTINPSTGEINWPNPQSTATDVVLTVVDAEDTEASGTWTIAVTTEGFKFVDAAADEGGTGTLASPWNTLADVHALSAEGEIVYFRAGTYTPAGITRTSAGTEWERIEIGSARSNQWIAYPGENVYYDAGYTGADPGALIRMGGTTTYPLYIDGIRFHNARNILLQPLSEGLQYQTVRRCEFYDIRAGIDGGNPAGIMTVTDNSGTNPCYWTVIQDNYGHDLVGAGLLKMYARFKCLMEDNRNIDCTAGPDMAKARMTRWEIRGTTVTGSTAINTQSGLYASMNLPAYTGYPFNGEIRFNYVDVGGSGGWACLINEFSDCEQIDTYRNTFVNGKAGVIRLAYDANNVADEVPYLDGPFRFYNNVIQNSETGDQVTKWRQGGGDAVATAPNVIVGTAVGEGRLDNLTGSSGLVNSDGTLADAYASYRGTHGFEV